LALIDKYGDVRAIDRSMDIAWTHAQLERRQFRIEPEDGKRFQQLAGHILYPSPHLRAPAERLRENRQGQSGLWAYGISGDLPICVVTIGDVRDIGLVRQALVAHNYLRGRGLKFDLLVLNEEAGSYGQPLMEQLKTMIAAHAQYTGMDQPGGIFLRPADQIRK